MRKKKGRYRIRITDETCMPEKVLRRGRERKPKPKEPRVNAKQTALAEAYVGGMTRREALIATGYSEKSGALFDTSQMKETIEAAKERLRDKPGLRLEDSLNFYASVGGNADVATRDRLTAQGRIDKIMGYETPQKIEINERKELSMAVALLDSLPYNPTELLAYDDDEAEITDTAEIEQSDNLKLSPTT